MDADYVSMDPMLTPSVDGLREDIDLLVNAILGGTSYLPHREAAERVRAALAATPTPAPERVDADYVSMDPMLTPDEYDDGIDHSVFEECATGHPDDHWQLDPICHRPTMVGPHWADRNDPPICGEPASSYVHRVTEGEDFHEFAPLIGPVTWGHGAWRKNPCPTYVDSEYADGQWQRLERARKCSCLCHRSTHYVNVYELEQGYGGPEEGGWYYEAGEPVASIPFDTLREAEAEREKLKVRFPEGRNRYSVAPRGTDYGVYIEGHYAASFPQHTPRYS